MMYKTDLKDETFDLSNAKQYSLLLQVLPYDFSYAIFDNNRNKFVLLRNVSFKNSKVDFLEGLKSLFANDEILKANYNSTKVILGSKKSVFVPKALFDKTKIISILNFNTKVLDVEQVFYNELKGDVFNIYAFNTAIYDLLFKELNKPNFFNQASVILANNIHKKSLNKKRIIVDVNSTFFDILYIENNKLVFRNTFDYTNETDFVFYIISVLDKFNFDNENDQLNITGIISIKSKETELLKKYVKKIRFKRTELNFSYVFNEIDISLYTNLLNLQFCE